MKATQEEIQEWKKKYGSVYELEADDKTCYVFSPINNLSVLKSFMQALTKEAVACVDVLLANCWIAGDEEIKTDDSIKLGIVDQVRDLVDYPDYDIEYNDEEKTAIIHVNGFIDFKVNLATRQDIRYAEDRNKGNKPLDTQMHLLERIACNKELLKEIRSNIPVYVSLLTAMDKVKDRKIVSLKKL